METKFELWCDDLGISRKKSVIIGVDSRAVAVEKFIALVTKTTDCDDEGKRTVKVHCRVATSTVDKGAVIPVTFGWVMEPQLVVNQGKIHGGE